MADYILEAEISDGLNVDEIQVVKKQVITEAELATVQKFQPAFIPRSETVTLAKIDADIAELEPKIAETQAKIAETQAKIDALKEFRSEVLAAVQEVKVEV